MSCISPVSIRDANRVSMAVPCGKCHYCRLSRVRQWCFRLHEERKHHINAYFCLFTYEITPKTPNGLSTLVKSDFQKFMKRLRKTQGKDGMQIKYYTCGEYGTKRRRPHYHAIILGAMTREQIRDSWESHPGNGWCSVLDYEDNGAVAYIVKYMDKGKQIPMFEADDRLPEFALMSKRLGSRYLTPEMISWHRRAPEGWSVQFAGSYSPLPRYFKDKIFGKIFANPGDITPIADFKYLHSEKIEEFKQKTLEKYQENVKKFGGDEYAYILHVHTSQAAKLDNIRLYEKLHQRGDY